jgi:hypothetical protein
MDITGKLVVAAVTHTEETSLKLLHDQRQNTCTIMCAKNKHHTVMKQTALNTLT